MCQGKEVGFVFQVWDRDVGEDDFLGYGKIENADISAYFLEEYVSGDMGETPGGGVAAATAAAKGPKEITVDLNWQDEPRGQLVVTLARADSKFLVTVVRGIELYNPAKEDAQLNADSGMLRNGAMIFLTYLITGCIVYISTCEAEHEQDDGTMLMEPWTIGDTLYFSIVTITTTGYGDLLPKTGVVKMWTCFYAFFGVVVISSIMGFIVARLMEHGERAIAMKKMKEALKPPSTKKKESEAAAEDALSEIPVKEQKPWLTKERRELITALGWVLFSKGCAVIMYTQGDKSITDDLQKGDAGCDFYNDACHVSLPFVNVLYMTAVSMTSVGYGDFSPSTPGGRFFAVIWLMFGTLSVAFFFGTLAGQYLDRKQEAMNLIQMNTKLDVTDIASFDGPDGDGKIDVVEYVSFMLQKLGKVDEDR